MKLTLIPLLIIFFVGILSIYMGFTLMDSYSTMSTVLGIVGVVTVISPFYVIFKIRRQKDEM